MDQSLRQFQRAHTFKKKLRKKHLTENTWTILQAKRNSWRQVITVRSAARIGLLRELWKGWSRVAQTRREYVQPHCFQRWIKWTDFEIARWCHLHRRLAQDAAQAVREDDQQFYDGLARQAGEVDAQHGMQKLWAEITAVLPKSHNKRMQSTLTQGPSQIDMQLHFDQLEAGIPMEFEDLTADCVRHQSLSQASLTTVDITELPTRLTVERLCHKTIPKKAPGLDQVDPTTIHQHAPIVGRALFDLFLKAWVLGTEPITWKGGQLYPLWKGKGSKRDAATYRGIVLLSALGKRWHALLRSRLLPHVMEQKLPTQFGGFPGQQPGFATSMIWAYSNIAKAKGLSDACLFLDLRAAFHHLIRQFAWNHGDAALSPQLIAALNKEGLDATKLQQRAQDSQQWGHLPLPKHLNDLIVDLHQCTWYTLKGAAEPSATTRGTRPGSPFADLGFNSFMSQAMIAIREMLWHHADLSQAMEIAGLEPIVVGWVDDLAVPLLSTSADQLNEMIQYITTNVVRIMWEAGLQVNLGKGKTECVATYRGS